MLPISPVQGTTPVALPDLSLDGFRELVRILEGQHPDEIARIHRGVQVLATSRIIETTEVGTFLVESHIPGQYYRANTFTCGCPDKMLGGVTHCKHVWAITLLVAGSVAARYERLTRDHQPIPFELTGEALAALADEPAPVPA